MKVKITKHFDYLTPLSEAKTKEELIEIATLKYPKACSILETDAGFFAKVAEELRKYRVWEALGFKSFEDFCVTEFKKTLDEVDGIVGTVKVLTRSGVEQPSLREVTKTQAIIRRRDKYPHETCQEIADEFDVSRQFVHKVLSTKPSASEKIVDTQFAPVSPAHVPRKLILNVPTQSWKGAANEIKNGQVPRGSDSKDFVSSDSKVHADFGLGVGFNISGIRSLYFVGVFFPPQFLLEK